MHQHKADQKPGERFAGAPKWLLDEDRVGPAKAWRHRRWMQAGLVGVDHDGKEWWNLEKPRDSDIPCTYGLLLFRAAEFFSCYFLEALVHVQPFCVRVRVCACMYVCCVHALWKHLFAFLLSFLSDLCSYMPNYSVFLCQLLSRIYI